MDLAAVLPTLLPKAIAWAEREAASAAAIGAKLNEFGMQIALAVGVSQPELIRVAIVDALPTPDDPELNAAAVQTGLLGPNMVGITLGHSVIVRRGYNTIRLLSHEFRHVYQYEQAGSIALFLPVYLGQIVQYGYNDAPFELDARQNEIVEAPE